MSEWIPARSAPYDKRGFIYAPKLSPKVYIAAYESDFEGMCWRIEYPPASGYYCGYLHVDDVTHWMPLPDPPC